jgi:hypothetical protein
MQPPTFGSCSIVPATRVENASGSRRSHPLQSVACASAAERANERNLVDDGEEKEGLG